MSAVGQNTITKLYIGTVEVLKGYLGTLVWYSGVTPTKQEYTNFSLDLQASQNANNVYTNFSLDLQGIKKI